MGAESLLLESLCSFCSNSFLFWIFLMGELSSNEELFLFWNAPPASPFFSSLLLSSKSFFLLESSDKRDFEDSSTSIELFYELHSTLLTKIFRLANSFL